MKQVFSGFHADADGVPEVFAACMICSRTGSRFRGGKVVLLDHWLNRLERKFGRYAIPELTKIIIFTYAVGYVLSFMGLTQFIALDPAKVLQGQVWRVISWILMPPGGLNLFTVIMLFFYFSIGTALERTWGDFRYNMYIFTGLFFTLIGAFGVYFAGLKLGYPAQVFGGLISSMISTYYVNMSLFLAFAASYPEMQVLLYFIIPVKIKWLAILDLVLIGWDLVRYPWYGKVVIVVSLLNFILFYLSTKDLNRIRPSEVHRRNAYRRAMDEGRRRGFRTVDGGSGGAGSGMSGRENTTITKHRCAVCGRTELTDPDMEFRFCSKCNGNYEYCSEHLHRHKHVK